VGFVDGSALKRVAVVGGAPLVIATLKGKAVGATWLPDDTIVFATNETTGLQHVSAAGGAATELTRVAREGTGCSRLARIVARRKRGPVHDHVSDGQGGCRSDRSPRLARPHPKILIPGASHAQYVASGHLVYVAAGALGLCRSTCEDSRSTGHQFVSSHDW
jgi:hypothetical protein